MNLRTHTALLSFPTRRSSDLPPPGESMIPSSVMNSVTMRVRMLGSSAHGEYLIVNAAAAVVSPEFSAVRSLVRVPPSAVMSSEEHTSELQSRGHIVCRLLHDK